MTRLIDADELKEATKQFGDLYGFNPVWQIIDNAPTVITDSLYETYCKMNDEEFEFTESFTVKTPKGKIVKFIKEKPQGEWYHSVEQGWHCSICYETVKDMPTIMREATYKFCPYCGAQMEKENEND